MILRKFRETPNVSVKSLIFMKRYRFSWIRRLYLWITNIIVRRNRSLTTFNQQDTKEDEHSLRAMSSKVLHCPCFQPRSASLGSGGRFWLANRKALVWISPNLSAGVHCGRSPTRQLLTSKHTSHTLLEIVLKDLRQLAFVPLSVWKFSQLKSLSLWFIKNARIFLQSTSCSGKTVKGLFRHERGSEVTRRVQRSFAVEIPESLESQSALECGGRVHLPSTKIKYPHVCPLLSPRFLAQLTRDQEGWTYLSHNAG
jgi:hypothetical protein